SIFEWVLLGYTAFYAVGQIAQALVYMRAQHLPQPNKTPQVCLLLAARNEADKIADTLESLLAQDYPTDRLTILVCDDGSEDATGEIIRTYAAQNAQLHYHRIDKQINGLHGKHNVLAVLSEHIPDDCEVLLFTDADITHSPGWVAQMTGVLTSGEAEMCSGTTLVEGPRLFHKLQTLDWLMGTATIVAFTRVGLPITAVGNNMGIRREWYERIGGYSGIPFSITEDYILFERLHQAGGRFRWLHRPELRAYSKPVYDLRTFFHQRKRWFKGGSKGPWYGVALFGFQAGLLPLLIWGLFLCSWSVVGLSFAAKVLTDGLLLGAAAARVQRVKLLRFYPFYLIYYPLEVLTLGIYFLLPGKVNWKGRQF
ncbi:MAG: glycosyltransferase, partial [Bacteroidota bacterium]